MELGEFTRSLSYDPSKVRSVSSLIFIPLYHSAVSSNLKLESASYWKNPFVRKLRSPSRAFALAVAFFSARIPASPGCGITNKHREGMVDDRHKTTSFTEFPCYAGDSNDDLKFGEMVRSRLRRVSLDLC